MDVCLAQAAGVGYISCVTTDVYHGSESPTPAASLTSTLTMADGTVYNCPTYGYYFDAWDSMLVDTVFNAIHLSGAAYYPHAKVNGTEKYDVTTGKKICLKSAKSVV